MSEFSPGPSGLDVSPNDTHDATGPSSTSSAVLNQAHVGDIVVMGQP